MLTSKSQSYSQETVLVENSGSVKLFQSGGHCRGLTVPWCSITVQMRDLLAMEKSFSTRNSQSSMILCGWFFKAPSERKKRKKEQTEAKIRKHNKGRCAGLSGCNVIRSRSKVSTPESIGLRSSAGQPGVGRRRKPHGANNGSNVLLLLIVLGQLPVKGNGFGCKLGQVFGAAVPTKKKKKILWEKS